MPLGFLDLPQETQDMIFRHHIQCGTLTVKIKGAAVAEEVIPTAVVTPTGELLLLEGASSTNKAIPEYQICFQGVPELVIESVCRRFKKDVRQLRSHLWPRALHLDYEDASGAPIDRLAKDIKYAWLHNHKQHFITDELPLGYREWGTYSASDFKFRQLKHFTLHTESYWSVLYWLTSPEELHHTVMENKYHWMSHGCICGSEVSVLSGGRSSGKLQEGITVTVIEAV